MDAMNYVDLQVNGAYGVDFNNDQLTQESFAFACHRLQEDGVAGFFPTIITDSIDRMSERISKIVRYLDLDATTKKLVLGIHVEGPFIASQAGYCGTHPTQHIREASESEAMRLLEAGNGMVRILTLAPEQDPSCQVIARLHSEKVIVMAGHTNAGLELLKKSIDHGLCGFTHLGNGCAHEVNRHDNIVQRILALHDELWVTLIADGIHLPDWILASWIRILGIERCIVISDSMSAAGMPPGEYSIGGQPIQVDASRRTTHRDHGYLAGSASTLADMDLWLSTHLKLTPEDRKKILRANALALISSYGT
jgi:N-acetylglucosamine-6-phosphate deacetylase